MLWLLHGVWDDFLPRHTPDLRDRPPAKKCESGSVLFLTMFSGMSEI